MSNEIERQKQIEDLLPHLAAALQETMTELIGPMGFALLVFEFYDVGISHYVSNAERKNMIEALREAADRLEAKQDIPPGHRTPQ